MLNNFFRINLPYGIACNDKDEWMAFNRESMPLGHNNDEFKGNPGKNFLELPVYTRFAKLTPKLLLDLAESEDRIVRDDSGKIIKIFLYGDSTNPTNTINDINNLWDKYFEKIKKLSKLKI